MELNVVSSDKNSLTLELSEINETVIYALVERLTADAKVETAQYTTVRSGLERPRIFVKVREGKPDTAVKRATKGLVKDFESLRETLEKAK